MEPFTLSVEIERILQGYRSLAYIKFIDKSGYSILSPVSAQLELRGNDIPPLFQNIGLAFLSILIPLAIVILTEVYKKKGKDDVNYCELDLQIILDHVFKIKSLILYSTLTFLPLVFWGMSCGTLRIIEITVSTIGVISVASVILNIYKWTKGNAFPFRCTYLRKLDNPNDLVVAWRSVWRAKNADIQEEREFLRIYFSKMDKIVDAYDYRH